MNKLKKKKHLLLVIFVNPTQPNPTARVARQVLGI